MVTMNSEHDKRLPTWYRGVDSVAVLLPRGIRLTLYRRWIFVVLAYRLARCVDRWPNPLLLLKVLLFGRTGVLRR
jgi:hypothetical protein